MLIDMRQPNATTFLHLSVRLLNIKPTGTNSTIFSTTCQNIDTGSS